MRLTTVAVAVIVALGSGACGAFAKPGPVVHEHHAIERGAAQRASVEIDMHAGELILQSGATTLLEGDFEFNVPSLKPVIAYSVSGSVGELKASQGSASGNFHNKWRLSLGETTPLDLRVNFGAGDAQLTLGRLSLHNLQVRQGAGDLEIDLRGTPTRSFSVVVQAGVGDITVRLPSAVGISARTNRLIGDVDASGLVQREGQWINPRADGSPVTIALQVQHAIGDIRLLAE